MKEKIVNLMKSEGLTSSRLAEILEIQPSGISHIVSGRNKPGFDLLQKILRRFPRINPDWLLLDSDVMYRGDLSEPFPQGEIFGGSIPSSMFEFGEVARGEVAPGAVSKNGGEIDASILDISSVRTGTKSGGFQGQNNGQNSGQNQGQNGANFSPQSFLNLPRNNASVERIIILYSDGTFATYNSPQK